MANTPDEQGKDQMDVLPAKDHVTKSSRGLQKWDDDAMGDGIGTASSGTAERAARIAAGQKKAKEREDGQA